MSTATASATPSRSALNRLALAADEKRARILLLLAGGSFNVTSLCEALSIGQPVASHHLSLMRASRVVVAERDGKCRRYSLTAKGRTLARAITALSD